MWSDLLLPLTPASDRALRNPASTSSERTNKPHADVYDHRTSTFVFAESHLIDCRRVRRLPIAKPFGPCKLPMSEQDSPGEPRSADADYGVVEQPPLEAPRHNPGKLDDLEFGARERYQRVGRV